MSGRSPHFGGFSTLLAATVKGEGHSPQPEFFCATLSLPKTEYFSPSVQEADFQPFLLAARNHTQWAATFLHVTNLFPFFNNFFTHKKATKHKFFLLQNQQRNQIATFTMLGGKYTLTRLDVMCVMIMRCLLVTLCYVLCSQRRRVHTHTRTQARLDASGIGIDLTAVYERGKH